MPNLAALTLLVTLGVLDLGLLAAASLRRRLGPAWRVLPLAPAGALAAVLAWSRRDAHPDLELAYRLGLPVFAFLAGFTYLVTSFLSRTRAGRMVFAAHTAAAVLLGVLATLALELLDP